MPNPIVLFDACVLYPAPLRDLLMQVALTGITRACWTNAIHDEWTRNVLKQRPDLQAAQLQRTRELMNAAVRDCLVEGFEHLIPNLTLPDADDRHVLAAAIHGGAQAIITFNLSDFPRNALEPHGIVALHPDNFLMQLFDKDENAVCTAVSRQRASLRNPPQTIEQLLETLERQGLQKTVARFKQLTQAI